MLEFRAGVEAQSRLDRRLVSPPVRGPRAPAGLKANSFRGVDVDVNGDGDVVGSQRHSLVNMATILSSSAIPR